MNGSLPFQKELLGLKSGMVKTGKAQREQMFSALPLKADIEQRGRYVRFVPIAERHQVHASMHAKPQASWRSFKLEQDRQTRERL